MKNKYNHYWMQAILKEGWSNDNDKVTYLNLKNILFNHPKNIEINLSHLLHLCESISTKKILGSQVISKETEEQLKISKIENDMLDFIRNRIFLPDISNEDLLILKEYCFLQIIRNPISYNAIYEELKHNSLAEENLISNINFPNKPQINFSSNEKLILSKLQSTKQIQMENSFRKKDQEKLLTNKKFFIFDISQHEIGFVVGDLTHISFSSKIILNNQSFTLLKDMITQYKLNHKRYRKLVSSIFIPITSNKVIFIYDTEEQKILAKEILDIFIHYYNNLQFISSSGIILPFKPNKNLFKHNQFSHSLNTKNIDLYLNRNLNIKLNKFLHNIKVNDYLLYYSDTIKNIELLKVLTKTSFEDKQIEIYLNYFLAKKNNNLDIRGDSNIYDFKHMFRDIFEFKTEQFNILFFFLKNGTIFYSINKYELQFFCLHYYDFFSRFLILLITLKIKIKMPVHMLFYFKNKAPESYYKQLTQSFMLNSI